MIDGSTHHALSLLLESWVVLVVGGVQVVGQPVEVHVGNQGGELDDGADPPWDEYHLLSAHHHVSDDLANVLLLQHRDYLVQAGLESSEHSSIDGIWANHTESYVGVGLSRKLSPDAVEEAIDCMLARHVTGKVVASHQRSHRSDGDDMPLQLILKIEGEEHRSEIIDCHSLGMVGVGLLVPSLGNHDTGVVNEHIYLIVVGPDFPQNIVHAVLTAEIAFVAGDDATLVLELLLDVLKLVGHYVQNDDPALVPLGKQKSSPPSDTVAGTRNDHNGVAVELDGRLLHVQLVHEVYDDEDDDPSEHN